jgi:predicted DNA-binding transcriptional regulator AlpA
MNDDASRPAHDLRALDAYLTAKDLERVLQVTERTLRRWIQDGTFPAPIRIGGVKRWRPEEVRPSDRTETGSVPGPIYWKRIAPIAVLPEREPLPEQISQHNSCSPTGRTEGHEASNIQHPGPGPRSLPLI